MQDAHGSRRPCRRRGVIKEKRRARRRILIFFKGKSDEQSVGRGQCKQPQRSSPVCLCWLQTRNTSGSNSPACCFISFVICSVLRIPSRNKGCWLTCFTDSHFTVVEESFPSLSATAPDLCWLVTEVQQGIALIAEIKVLLCVCAEIQIFTTNSATELQTKSTSLCICFPAGLVGGLNKQIWHVKRVSNVARSLHERPGT